MPTRRARSSRGARTRSSSRSARSPARPGRACRRGTFAPAIELLNTARALAEGSVFSDVDRAESCSGSASAGTSFRASSTAVALLDEALSLAERSDLPCDGLRSDIYHWRSRCHRRQRDFEAAREDVEHALELAAGRRRPPQDGGRVLPGVARRRAHGSLGALAELRRAGQEPLPGARRRADRGPAAEQPRRPQPPAREAAPGDRAAEGVVRGRGRGRLARATPARPWAASPPFTSGSASGMRPRSTRARRCSCSKAAKTSSTRSASPSSCSAARCSSADRFDEAEESFRAADATFEQLSSISHRANVWVALGDLAARRGQDTEAARLYRNAAEALQDMRF